MTPLYIPCNTLAHTITPLLPSLCHVTQTHPELQGIPVFYASKLATKALRVYQTFVNMMNQHIRTLMDVINPFKLNFIKNMQRTDFDTVGKWFLCSTL